MSNKSLSDFENEYFAYFESKGFRDAEGKPIGDDPKFNRMVNTSASMLRRWHLSVQEIIKEDPEFAEYLESLKEIKDIRETIHQSPQPQEHLLGQSQQDWLLRR